jgi:hypothetical protein
LLVVRVSSTTLHIETVFSCFFVMIVIVE